MKKILILFLSILVISCSSGGVNAGLGGSSEKSISSDALNFTLSDAQLSNYKADFTDFEIKDGYIVGGSDTIVYFTAPTLYPDFNATTGKISQLEIMRALDEVFSTAITNQASLRSKLAPDAVSVVVVEMGTTTPPTHATVVVRLFAAEGYRFGSSGSSARSRGMDPTVKDIIIKVAVEAKNTPARAGATTKIGKVAITEFDYYFAPTKTNAGVEYAKINLDDSATFDNLVIIPPIDSEYTSRTTANEAIRSFILNATKHGTSLKTDGTVVSVPTLSIKEPTRNNSKTDEGNYTVTLTITKIAGYKLPNDTTYTRTVNSTLSFGEFATVITDAAITGITFPKQDITDTVELNVGDYAAGKITATVTVTTGTVVVNPTQVQKAVSNSIADSTDTAGIGVANNFTVAMPILSSDTKTMSTKVTINALDGYVFEDNKDNKIIDITITATGDVTFHDGKVNEATLITELNTIVGNITGDIAKGAKFKSGTAKMTKADGFTATITGAADTTLKTSDIASGVRNLLGDIKEAPTGIVNEYIKLTFTISNDGKIATATATLNASDEYVFENNTKTKSIPITFTADENVTFE